MDPVFPPGWNVDQRELAEWSDNCSETSMSSSTTVSSSFTELDEDEDDHISPYGYFKLIQLKKVYKVILEEEDLIK